MSINVVTLMGRLTQTPELKTTSSGIETTSFTVAVDRRFQKDQTDFINIVAWRQSAKFITNYFKKGQMIAITGSLQARNFTDKNGNKRTVYEVVADNISFCGGKGSPDAEIASVGSDEAEIDDFEELDTSSADYPF